MGRIISKESEPVGNIKEIQSELGVIGDYLKCDGRTVDANKYPKLYEKIGSNSAEYTLERVLDRYYFGSVLCNTGDMEYFLSTTGVYKVDHVNKSWKKVYDIKTEQGRIETRYHEVGGTPTSDLVITDETNKQVIVLDYVTASHKYTINISNIDLPSPFKGFEAVPVTDAIMTVSDLRGKLYIVNHTNGAVTNISTVLNMFNSTYTGDDLGRTFFALLTDSTETEYIFVGYRGNELCKLSVNPTTNAGSLVANIYSNSTYQYLGVFPIYQDASLGTVYASGNHTYVFGGEYRNLQQPTYDYTFYISAFRQSPDIKDVRRFSQRRFYVKNNIIYTSGEPNIATAKFDPAITGIDKRVSTTVASYTSMISMQRAEYSVIAVISIDPIFATDGTISFDKIICSIDGNIVPQLHNGNTTSVKIGNFISGVYSDSNGGYFFSILGLGLSTTDTGGIGILKYVQDNAGNWQMYYSACMNTSWPTYANYLDIAVGGISEGNTYYLVHTNSSTTNLSFGLFTFNLDTALSSFDVANTESGIRVTNYTSTAGYKYQVGKMEFCVYNGYMYFGFVTASLIEVYRAGISGYGLGGIVQVFSKPSLTKPILFLYDGILYSSNRVDDSSTIEYSMVSPTYSVFNPTALPNGTGYFYAKPVHITDTVSYIYSTYNKNITVEMTEPFTVPESVYSPSYDFISKNNVVYSLGSDLDIVAVDFHVFDYLNFNPGTANNISRLKIHTQQGGMQQIELSSAYSGASDTDIRAGFRSANVARTDKPFVYLTYLNQFYELVKVNTDKITLPNLEGKYIKAK